MKRGIFIAAALAAVISSMLFCACTSSCRGKEGGTFTLSYETGCIYTEFCDLPETKAVVRTSAELRAVCPELFDPRSAAYGSDTAEHARGYGREFFSSKALLVYFAEENGYDPDRVITVKSVTSDGAKITLRLLSRFGGGAVADVMTMRTVIVEVPAADVGGADELRTVTYYT